MEREMGTETETGTMTDVLLPLACGGRMKAQAVASDTFRIRMNGTGAFPESPLMRYGIVSAVEEAKTAPFVWRAGGEAEIRSGRALLRIGGADGQLRLYGPDGDVRLRTSAPLRTGLSGTGGFEARFSLQADEALYGLGNIAPERMNRRGQRVEIWAGKDLWASAPIPYLMSSAGWAVMMNTTRRHTFDIGAASGDELSIAGQDGELDLFLYVGDGYAELLDAYTNIAGKPPLLPIWMYGLNFCSRVKSSARDVLDDAIKFRRSNTPCDLIGLSADWMEQEGDHSIHKRWHPVRFPTSTNDLLRQVSFIGILQKQGFKLSLTLGCDYDLTAYEERLLGGGEGSNDGGPVRDGPDGGGGERGDGPRDERDREGRQGREDREPAGQNRSGQGAGLSGDENRLEAIADGSEEPWYEHLRKFVDDGISGFVLSATHPANSQPGRVWANGMTSEELHHLYPLLLGKQMHVGFRGQTNRRPAIHMEKGYLGMQRFVASTTGTFYNARHAIAAILNYGLSGHAHTSTNMHLISREGIHADFLLAWSRINSQDHFHHPDFLEHPLQELFRRYARLRYRLIPYIYSAAHVAARTGMPITRAMPLMYPADRNCRELSQQYMLGDFLLVAVYTDQVYLPEGEWFDYWTGERHSGSRWVACEVPAGAGGPLFVQAGAIVPMGPAMDYIGQAKAETLTLELYPGPHGQFVLYEDDGVTFDYLNGRVARTHMSLESGREGITVRISRREGDYDGMPARRSYELIVRTEGKPAAVLVDGQRRPDQTRRIKSDPFRSWRYDRLAGTVRLNVDEATFSEAGVCVEIVHSAYSQKGGPAVAPSAAASDAYEAYGRSGVRTDRREQSAASGVRTGRGAQAAANGGGRPFDKEALSASTDGTAGGVSGGNRVDSRDDRRHGGKDGQRQNSKVDKRQDGKDAADFADEAFVAALGSGEPRTAEAALAAWWEARMKPAASAAVWQLHAMRACHLIVRHAEQSGWNAADVFGGATDGARGTALLLQTPEQSYEQLLRFVRELFRAAEAHRPAAKHPAVRELLAIIQREPERDLSLNAMAERCALHPFHLSRLFKKETGFVYSDYVMSVRMTKAKKLLEAGQKVYETAARCGFKDAGNFSKAFSKYWGVPPVCFKPERG